MSVQAMIMAGGEGVRLRPLTVYLPKPLVPLAGEPVMGYALRLLKSHGVEDVGVTLWYRPRDIRARFGRGEGYGVRLRYYEESHPMGTAGSMKMARDHLKGTFFVLSGDCLTDCDLTAALAFHREKKALATLVLRRVHVPLPYGVVLCGEDGRITRFIEKPAWSRVFSNLVNTGVYILEPEIFDRIPDLGAPDFGKDIFPALVADGLPVYGFETAAYWCDVGDLSAYLSAQRALLGGETAFSAAAGPDPLAQVDATARLEGPCAVGKGSVIGEGAVIRNSVIGEGCRVSPGAVVENSCLWDRACVGEKARITGSVLCRGAAARQGAEMADGCALGDAAVAGAHARLLPGVRIWPHLKALPEAEVKRSLVSGDSAAPQWTANGALCDTAEDACVLMRAYARLTGARRVMAAGEKESAALGRVLSGALAAQGLRVLWAGEMTRGMLRLLTRELGLDGGVFSGGHAVQMLGAGGLPLEAGQTAALNALVLRGENDAEFTRPGTVTDFSGGEEIYLSRLLPRGDRPLLSPVTVSCENPYLRKVAQRGLERMGVRLAQVLPEKPVQGRPGETQILLSPAGERMQVLREGKPVEEGLKELLLLKLILQRNGKLFDLLATPRAAARLSPLLLPDGSDACFDQRVFMEDGLAALFLLCGALKDGPLDTWLSTLPETYIRTRDIPCLPQDKGRVLHALCGGSKLPREMGDGVRFRHETGSATVMPDAYRNAVRITAEAAKYELAEELCDFYQNQIKRVTNMS